MNKFFYLSAIALCAIFASCNKSDDNPDVPVDPPMANSLGAFVLNQGSYYSKIEGGLTYIDYTAKKATQNMFQTTNGRSLGAQPQTAIVYGDKVYIGVYESNTIEVVDRNTMKSVKQISLEGAEGQGPRSFVAKNGKLYVSMFNGFVSRLDTVTLSIEKSVKVGPNPEVMALRGDNIYVPNSDGMNWEVGYGKTASVIDINTFTVTKTMNVGLNPTKFVSNGSELFLLCMGDYNEVLSTVYKINNDDTMTEVGKATHVAINGNSLYYINAPFGAEKIDYKVYDTKDGTQRDMLKDDGVDYPAEIAIDPTNGLIFIASYELNEYGYPSYTTDGYLNIYNINGQKMGNCKVGVTPTAIFFNYPNK